MQSKGNSDTAILVDNVVELDKLPEHTVPQFTPLPTGARQAGEAEVGDRNSSARTPYVLPTSALNFGTTQRDVPPEFQVPVVVQPPAAQQDMNDFRGPMDDRNPRLFCLIVTAVFAVLAMLTCWLSGAAAFGFTLKAIAHKKDRRYRESAIDHGYAIGLIVISFVIAIPVIVFYVVPNYT